MCNLDLMSQCSNDVCIGSDRKSLRALISPPNEVTFHRINLYCVQDHKVHK